MERIKSLKNLTNQQRGSLLAFVAVILITPDSLLIRLSNIETWGMLFYRGAIPFGIVLIGLLIFYNKNFLKALFDVGYTGIFYTISFAICNITFLVSIQNTNVANTLVMVAMAPMISAILGGIFLKEAPDKKTWVAILITFFSAIYIFYDSIQLGNFFGDFMGFVTATGLAVNAVLVRSAKDRDLLPSAVLGKLCVAIFAFFFVESFDLVGNDGPSTPITVHLDNYDNVSPNGYIAYPYAGQNVSGLETINIFAEDNNEVSVVEFYIDNNIVYYNYE